MPNFDLMQLEKTRRAEGVKSSVSFLVFQLYALKDFNAIKKKESVILGDRQILVRQGPLWLIVFTHKTEAWV